MMEWQLDRNGVFTVRTQGQNHCGTTPVLDIRYNLSVITDGDSLDDRGFLFDQMRIQKMAESHRMATVSCERFTREFALYIWRHIKLENPRMTIKKIALTLSPHPYAAAITFRYEEDHIPTVSKTYGQRIKEFVRA